MAKKLTPKDLIDFEKDIKKIYEKGLIKAPIHLSGNNEKQLIAVGKLSVPTKIPINSDLTIIVNLTM